MWFVTFALKNLFRRKTRSAVTMVGVTLAVGTMVALVGLADQFERSFAEVFTRRGADIMVLKAGSTQRLASPIDERIGDRLRAIPGVAKVVTGLVEIASFDDGDVPGVTINGWRADSPLFEDLRLVDGRRLRPDDGRSVMIGRLLAERLGKRVGDTLDVEAVPFRVVGVYEGGTVQESFAVVILLQEMQQLFDQPGKVTGFMVMLDEDHRAEAHVAELCRRIKTLTSDSGRLLNLEALSTQDYVSKSVEIRTVKFMAWATTMIALVLSAVAMFNTMVMAVFERTAEIGILQGVGWRRRRIVALILCESAVLSLAGSLAGAVLAVLIVALLAYVPQAAGFVSGRIAVTVILQGIVVGLAVGSLAGLYPAIRAATLTPTEALRHD